MLTQLELDVLNNTLPTDWVKRVRQKINISASKIRQALRHPKPQDTEILNIISDVAAEYQAELDKKLSGLKSKITALDKTK